ncbi:MAG: metal-dependent transcriptional regulator [Candidatus Thermoplasmatota archaeon]|nr:metal-dependent transcriptional regulator [Candidatus Thermoplasmatota archaeon]
MRKKTIEDYVELIYILQHEKQKVHTSDIANTFDINPASVTEMFQKLSKEQYITYEKYNGVTLTPKGKKIAIQTKQKHDTLKHFLMILGVTEAIADEDACRIEHTITPLTMEKLTKFVKFVNQTDGHQRWLDHYKYFDKTGKIIRCTPETESQCPIHVRHHEHLS